MALTVTKTGPFFDGSGGASPNNQTNVQFSQLRDTFRLNNPTGSISASELLRDIDTNSSDPIVPDATENSNIASNTLSAIAAGTIAPDLDLKVSQFFGAIKFFDIEQDDTDNNTNFNISGITEFNDNLGKTIKKKLILRGTHTSTDTDDPAAETLFDAFNLTLEVHGVFYGAGGAGGTLNSRSGKNGGSAIRINGGSVTIDIKSGARIWGGGGGGEFGGDGTPGVAGTCREKVKKTNCTKNTFPSCPAGFTEVSKSTGDGCAFNEFCWVRIFGKCLFRNVTTVKWTRTVNCRKDTPSPVPATARGGNGGAGRGFNNFSGSLKGSKGSKGSCPDCATISGSTLIGGSGKCSGDAERGGNGGDWGQNGKNTSSSGSGGSGGAAIAGTGFSVSGNNSDTVKGSI
tara:strand:- start:883 stop:2085 length:1203 start_codon:yes stop_codon:yes gene_type:complete